MFIYFHWDKLFQYNINLEIHKQENMQILQHQLTYYQFSTNNSISSEVQDIVPKSKKIIKTKKQSISKNSIKNFLVSKLKKDRNTKKTLKSKLSTYQENFQKIQMDKFSFCCPICIELLIQPVVTECGHAFCHKCLQSLMQYNSRCPVCRQEVQMSEIIVEQNLNNLLTKLVSQSFTDLIFQCERNYESFDWLLRKRSGFQSLQLGQYVDIKCLLTNKWTQGCIVEIIQKQNQKKVCVSYTSKQNPIKEWLNFNSGRLACHQFFTGRKIFKEIKQVQNFFQDVKQTRDIKTNVELESQSYIQFMERYGTNTENSYKMQQSAEQKDQKPQAFLQELLNEGTSNFWNEVDFL